MRCSDNANKRKIFDTDEEFDKFVGEVMEERDDDWAQDRETAEDFIKNLLKDADSGNAESQLAIAQLFDVTKRREEAEEYFRMAAEQGNADAVDKLVNLLTKIGSYEKARKYFRLVANSGNPDAQLNLGVLLYKLDREEIGKLLIALAEGSYRRAAKSGDPEAAYKASRFFRRYYVTEEDFEEGVRYLKIAADSGMLKAQAELCKILYSREKIEEAEKYFKSDEEDD